MIESQRNKEGEVQQTYGFTNQEMDQIRMSTGGKGSAIISTNIDESTCSMALTEIKQTPQVKKGTDIESSLSIQNSDSREARKKNNARDPKEAPLVINVMYTQYEVLKDCGDELNFVLSYDEEEDWDIYWIDGPVAPTFLLKMQLYQRTNHFPGMYALARKNLLAKNLMAIKKACPSDFNFFPKTWLLPQDAKDFKTQFNNKKAKTFIVKPEASCQGKGIFLTRNFEWLQAGEHYVAQRYLHKPYLIDKLKFDLRIYVLVTGMNPLRAYIYHEGLARFATEVYQSPLGSNLGDLCMHLTNYAINKDSDDFVFNEDPNKDDVGHKRSLRAVFDYIERNRKNPGDKTAKQIWADIKDVIVKTLITGQPHIAHLQRSSKPDDFENSMCFQILGFDIFIDAKGKSWLLEVNQSPSFTTDTPLDYTIKKNLIADAIHILNLSWKRKNKYIQQKRLEQQKRVLVGKTKLNQEEKEQQREKKLKVKDKFEQANLGGYEMLYPLKRGADQEDDALMDKYEYLLAKSKEIWEESIAGGGYIKRKEKDEGQPAVFKAGGAPQAVPQQVAPTSQALPKPGSSQSNRRTQNNFNKQLVTTSQKPSNHAQKQHVSMIMPIPQGSISPQGMIPINLQKDGYNGQKSFAQQSTAASSQLQQHPGSANLQQQIARQQQQQDQSFFKGYHYIREEAEADYIRLSYQVNNGLPSGGAQSVANNHQYLMVDSPVKIKAPSAGHHHHPQHHPTQPQNSFTSLESKQQANVLALKNQSVDQSAAKQQMFQKKQSQPISSNSAGTGTMPLQVSNQQPQALTATMNQLIPLLQQQLLNAKAANQVSQQQHLAGRQGQHVMSFTQQQQQQQAALQLQNEQMLMRINSIDGAGRQPQILSISQPQQQQPYIIGPASNNNQPSQRNSQQRSGVPASTNQQVSTQNAIMVLNSTGQNLNQGLNNPQIRQQSLKGLLGLEAAKNNHASANGGNGGGDNGFMLRGLSLNKTNNNQFQFYRTPYQKQ